MESTGIARTRVRSIDVFKGIAIFCIVAAHLVILEAGTDGSTGAFSGAVRTLLEFFYAGLIVFFIISGYFSKPEEGLSRRVIGRVVKFAVLIVSCIVLLEVVLYGYLLLLGYDISASDLLSSILFNLSGNGQAFQPYDNITSGVMSQCEINPGYYFIIVLAISTILYHLIARYALKDNVCTVVIVIALLTASMFCVEVIQVKLPYNLQLAPIGTAAMICGSVCHKYGLIERMEADPFDRRIVIAALASLALGLLLCWSPLRLDLGFHNSHFGQFGGFSAYSLLLIALVVGYFQMYICVLLSKVPCVSDLLMLVGRYSLEILMLGTFFSKLVIAPFITLPALSIYPSLTIPQVLLIAVVAVALSIAATYAIRRILSGPRKRRDLGNSSSPIS